MIAQIGPFMIDVANPNHVVALSGGKDSTAMALRLRETEPKTDFEFVCTPTGDEPESLFAHWNHLGELLGRPIIPVVHPLGLSGLISAQNALPSYRMRWCTRMLKIEPFLRYLTAKVPCVAYVGLRADEEDREGGIFGQVPGVATRHPLKEWRWGLGEVLGYLETRGIVIPERTDCNRCFFQTLYEWYLLWRDQPAVYAHAECQEATTGHTFRSPQRDTQPASLAGLRAKFEAGYIPKDLRKRDTLKALQCRACTL